MKTLKSFLLITFLMIVALSFAPPGHASPVISPGGLDLASAENSPVLFVPGQVMTIQQVFRIDVSVFKPAIINQQAYCNDYDGVGIIRLNEGAFCITPTSKFSLVVPVIFHSTSYWSFYDVAQGDLLSAPSIPIQLPGCRMHRCCTC